MKKTKINCSVILFNGVPCGIQVSFNDRPREYFTITANCVES